MHIFTHLKPESQGKTGLGVEADGMVEFDGMVGQLLKARRSEKDISADMKEAGLESPSQVCTLQTGDGRTWTITLRKGMYTYQCDPHAQRGMKGTFKVT